MYGNKMADFLRRAKMVNAKENQEMNALTMAEVLAFDKKVETFAERIKNRDPEAIAELEVFKSVKF